MEISRKLCAGLAAAHTKGVLHLDLKPGNVMVDRHGEVRIMDFGLAAATEQPLDAADLRSGTPAYMAPERLAGRHATAASDIYALGLILYEVFTGKPAWEESNAAKMLRLRETGLPTPPSAFVPDIEPSIERSILRCLEPDARLRPVSALAVAAALPGIDPLAAALAVGDTPSPEMVAAASPDVVLQPAAAAALLVFIAVALAGALLLTERTQMTSLVPMQNPPEALAAKARDIVRGAGYDDPDADAAYGFRDERGYLEYGETRVSPLLPRLSEWKKLLGLRPAPVSFWYGQSTRDFVPPIAGVAGAAAPLDSLPAVRAGVSVDFDLDGRLLRFVNPAAGISAQVAPRTGPNWDFFFAAAGLSIEQFTEKASQQQAVNAANRVVWDGSYLGRADVPVRVEGVKSVAGVISFELWFPWTSREARYPQAIDYRNAVFFILLWLTPFVVARYNWLRGRGDLRGALRVGAAVCVAELGFLVLSAHHPLTAFVTRPVIWNSLGSGVMARPLWLHRARAMGPPLVAAYPDRLGAGDEWQMAGSARGA